MARSDLILNLVRAAVSGNQEESIITARALAADERSKKHSGVADRINKILLNSNSSQLNGKKPFQPINGRDGNSGFQISYSDRPLSSLFLQECTRSTCLELIEEQNRAELLRANGLEPRHKLLLVGPPGNGKTSLAECLAYELALPLFIVRYDAIVTSYLGETAQRLRKLFDHINMEPCVLFFDEFDAIGKERGDLHETGEIKRVVTNLLLQIDALPSYCVLVAATNHPELLDRASLRRFQIQLELGHPSKDLMKRYFKQKLEEFGMRTGVTAESLYKTLNPQNFSEAESFFLDVHRQLILSQGSISCSKLFKNRIAVWNKLKKNNGI